MVSRIAGPLHPKKQDSLDQYTANGDDWFMREDLEGQIAEAMECTPDFLPLLPEILEDLEELGGSAARIVELLRPLELPSGARVLDLGSGKGAVLLAVVDELDVDGVGVDAFPPFVEAAQKAARQRGLADRCSFHCGDLRDAASRMGPFNTAMMLGLGLAIGDQGEIVGILRRHVRPGGYLVVDDAFLPDGVEEPVPGYDGYADHDTTLARLRSFGDEILQEKCSSPRPPSSAFVRITRRSAAGRKLWRAACRTVKSRSDPTWNDRSARPNWRGAPSSTRSGSCAAASVACRNPPDRSHLLGDFARHDQIEHRLGLYWSSGIDTL